MKISSIRGRIGLLFLAFALLAAVSVGATFWGIETQKRDARIINLAGRQRMLVQQMTRLALEIERQGEPADVQALREAAASFDQTLSALRDGGLAPYLPGRSVEVPPTREADLRAQLERVGQSWQAMRPWLEAIYGGGSSGEGVPAAVRAVERSSQELVAQADSAVRLYEAAASRKIARLRWVQAGFSAGALLLLLLGAALARRSVLDPLKELGSAAGRIGSGDLGTPLRVAGPDEVRRLAEAFEAMRARLLASQRESLAWTNALEERAALRMRELEALYQVSREISSRLDVRHVLHSVAEKARQLLGAEVAFLCLVDEGGEQLVLQAADGPAEAAIRRSARLQEPLPARVLAGDRALPGGAPDCPGSCSILASQFRASHLAAPLRMGDRVSGALCVGSSKAGVFSPEAESLLTRLASSAAVALENARLYAQAERLAILEERQRIAAEMHDGLAQTLNYLRIAAEMACAQVEESRPAQALATLQRAQQALERAENEVRRAIASLQEDFPLSYSLQEQLAKLAEEFSTPQSPVDWSTGVNVPLVLAQQEAEQVLRVAREALFNACRHARARRIRLRLEEANGSASLLVEDDGQGFQAQAQPPEDGRQHFGLKIMQARAARLNGSLEVRSAPGSGTRVCLTWPLGAGERQARDG